MIHVLSLGAGVQSSTLALMAALGEVTPMPDCAIFADTKAEPQHVYHWLNWLESQLPFPVHHVTKAQGLKANIQDAIEGGRFAGAPFFTESDTGREGRLRRQCTREFKVDPIRQKLRELLGAKKGERLKGVLVEQWIGISMDEAIRMKPSREKWIRHRWPLTELGMTRLDCLQWMKSHGYPEPSKSSCTFCPYHDNALWRDIKMNDPAGWAEAVEVDELIRKGVRGTTQKLYLHRSLKPLREVDFSTAEDRGQIAMFGEECEGMCGV